MLGKIFDERLRRCIAFGCGLGAVEKSCCVFFLKKFVYISVIMFIFGIGKTIYKNMTNTDSALNLIEL